MPGLSLNIFMFVEGSGEGGGGNEGKVSFDRGKLGVKPSRQNAFQ